MSENKTGKTIVEIKAKKKAITVSFDDGTKIVLSENSYTDHHLFNGKEISLEEFAALKKASAEDDYYDIAVRYLIRDSHSAHQVWEKLESKGADEETIRSILSQLRKNGLLNDELYAQTYLQDVAELKLIGKNRVRYDLVVKGISNKIIDALVFDREVELRRACAYAARLNKKEAKTPSARKRIKMVHDLMNRGFDSDVANSAVSQEITVMTEEDEMTGLAKAYGLAKAKYEKKYKGYDLKKQIYAYLLRKGYPYEEIGSIMEGDNHENF